MADEDGLAHAEVVQHPRQQVRRSSPVLCAFVGQAEGAAVAGRVDGDDLEAEVDEARQRLRVEDALGGEPVDHDQRDASAADRHADLVAVGEGDQVAAPGCGRVTSTSSSASSARAR